MNILWIVTTQWRAGACGSAGNQDVVTPTLDALARRSINFIQAVTPHPFGPFARAALLTGVESPKNRVRDYYDPLPDDACTIAHRFQQLGRATAFFGKWHLARRDAGAPLVGEAHARMLVPPEARGGFDFWEGFEGGFQLNNPWLHGTRLPTPLQVDGYQSDVLCRRTAEWVEAAGTEQPWFCVMSLEAPHPPYDQAPAGARPAEEGLELPANVPRGGRVESRARKDLAGYYAHIAATDRAIGALLARIDQGTTAIFFTSVHGDMHGSHGLFRKGWPYEESVRVPLLIGLPGGTGRRAAAAVSLTQLPEMALACSDEQAKEVEGRLLSFGGAWSRISMPSVVALPDQCDRVWRGLRSAERKLVVNQDDSPWLFFDLANDPGETRNLVEHPDYREEVERWQETLRAAQ